MTEKKQDLTETTIYNHPKLAVLFLSSLQMSCFRRQARIAGEGVQPSGLRVASQV